MKPRYAIILLALVFIIGLIVLAPATLIQGPANRAMAPNAALAVTSGTIWSGSGTLALFPTARSVIVPITWRFDPLALLRLRLGFYLSANSSALAGNARVGAGMTSIELRDTDMKIDGALISRSNSMLSLFGPRGTLHLKINDGDRIITPYQTQSGIRTAEGKLAVKFDSLTLRNLSSRPLGTYDIAVKLNNSTAEYAFVNCAGNLKFDGGGTVSWGSARTFVYRGLASTPRESSFLLAPLLAVGRPTADGRLQINYNTNW